MKINEVEQLSGISKKNIRFYEQEGLLKPDRNHENGYREYTAEDVTVLRKIRLLRRLSVPLDEIRKIQQSQLTLSDCMERHLVYLQREEENLKLTREICNEIIAGREHFDSIEIDHYLEEMEQMEKEGARFEHNEPVKRTGRKISVVASAVVCAVLLTATIVFFLYAYLAAAMPLGALLLMCTLPTVAVIAIIAVTIMRMKEIRGGEEDEAAKY